MNILKVNAFLRQVWLQHKKFSHLSSIKVTKISRTGINSIFPEMCLSSHPGKMPQQSHCFPGVFMSQSLASSVKRMPVRTDQPDSRRWSTVQQRRFSLSCSLSLPCSVICSASQRQKTNEFNSAPSYSSSSTMWVIVMATWPALSPPLPRAGVWPFRGFPGPGQRLPQSYTFQSAGQDGSQRLAWRKKRGGIVLLPLQLWAWSQGRNEEAGGHPPPQWIPFKRIHLIHKKSKEKVVLRGAI